MRSFYKIFPFILLFITGCYSLFGPKTNVTAGFVLEIAPGSPVEKIKEILKERLLNNGFFIENIKIENIGNTLEFTFDNYDSTDTPLTEVRKLLTSAGELEFWETYDSGELIPSLSAADKRLAEILAVENPAIDSSDHPKDTSSVMQMLLSSSSEKYRTEHPLFIILLLSVDQQGKVFPGPVIGRSLIKDTARVMSYLNHEEIKNIFPMNSAFRWGKTVGVDSVMSLIALKTTRKDGRAAMSGQIVSDARKEYSEQTQRPHISMTMTDEAAKTWAQLTEANIGKSIAIVFDGQVFSYPTVQSQITGGVSQITGDFTDKEAEAMVSMLKAGILTSAVKIKSEIIIKKEK